MKRVIKVGDKGKQLFKEWEGFSNKVYLDSGFQPTIGIGHLLTTSERKSGKIYIKGEPCFYHACLTDKQVWDLLDQDLEVSETAINAWVHVILNQNQFDALCSFVFNVGIEAFRTSTLLKLLNDGKYDEVPGQLARWNKDNGKVVEGLKNRREKEVELWIKK